MTQNIKIDPAAAAVLGEALERENPGLIVGANAQILIIAVANDRIPEVFSSMCPHQVLELLRWLLDHPPSDEAIANAQHHVVTKH